MIQILAENAQNRAHFVRRYLKHAVSSEAVTVVVLCNSTTNWKNNSSLGPRMQLEQHGEI